MSIDKTESAETDRVDRGKTVIDWGVQEKGVKRQVCGMDEGGDLDKKDYTYLGTGNRGGGYDWVRYTAHLPHHLAGRHRRSAVKM